MKQIRLNAFDMNCVGHIQQGLWRHPRDRSTDYTSLKYWTDLAQTFEQGLFDGIFLADVLGVYDVHGSSPAPAIAHAVQIPVNDPAMLIPAMAVVTQNLGFGVTANLSYDPPFPFARRLSTLDHLTQGRVGWNIVTGYLDSAARAFGQDRQRPHDARYEVAEDYMQAIYQLWESSWTDQAVKRDRASGLYADPTQVRPIHHHGPHVQLDAIHLCEPSPQRTPVLYQAGASGPGKAFAARHAECVFLNGGPKPTVRAHVQDLRTAVQAAGRAHTDLKIFLGATVIVAETESLAQAKLADYAKYASPEAALVHASASLGIDLDRLAPDDLIAGPSNAITSNLAALAGTTKKQLLAKMTLGSRQPPLVGSPAQIADALIAWTTDADIDGFILSRTVTPECVEDFVRLVVPELQRRGAYKTEYAPGTLREKLFSNGPRLPKTHPAAATRSV